MGPVWKGSKGSILRVRRSLPKRPLLCSPALSIRDPRKSHAFENPSALREIDRIVAQSVFAIVPDGEIGLQRQTSFHFKLSLVGSSAQGESRRIVEVRDRMA